jgi:YD repeat-containing protein
VTDPLPAVTTMVYDAHGRLTEEDNPAGDSTFRSYDAYGDVTDP